MSRTSMSSLKAAKREITFFLFVSPWILGFLVFTVFPFVASFLLSFTEYRMITTPKFVGIQNYMSIFRNRTFLASTRVTLIYAAVVAPGRIIMALLLAMLLNSKFALRNLYRTIFYIPSVASSVAVALLWRMIFNADFGLLNAALRSMRIEGPGWLIDTTWALPSVMLMSLWNIGVPMVIFLAGLQSISPDLYDAANIDGANGVQKFWNVTFPMLSPIIFFNLIFQIVQCFQAFTEAYMLTGGGPGDSTRLAALLLYETAFKYLMLGEASAIAWILFMELAAITWILFRTSNRWVYYAVE
jgi:multiple sugar transport system permease protein